MQSDSDKSYPSNRPAAGLFFGLALILIAGVGWYMSGNIQSIGFQDPSDPGPVFFPRALLSFLGLGGIFETIRHTRRWKNQSQPDRESSKSSWSSHITRQKYTLVGLVGMAVLIGLMPYLGFPLCAVLFLALISRTLGINWKLAAVFSLMMTAVIWVVFVWGLQAPLPEGSIW